MWIMVLITKLSFDVIWLVYHQNLAHYSVYSVIINKLGYIGSVH